MVSEHKIKTADPDPRFQNGGNVSSWCYQSFLDYHKCRRLIGKRDEKCKIYLDIYKSICPNEWIKEWEQRIKDETFQGRLPGDDQPKKKKRKPPPL